MDWTVIAAAVLGGGLLGQVFNYFATKRNADRASLVNDTAKIQEVYEKTLDDMTARHERDKTEWEKEKAKMQGQLEAARQSQGEMLVKMEDMQAKLNQVGEDVNQITGDFKRFPLVGDSQPYGRRATDKPQTGA